MSFSKNKEAAEEDDEPPPSSPATRRLQRRCVFLTAALMGLCMGVPYCLQTLLVDFLEAELPVSWFFLCVCVCA